MVDASNLAYCHGGDREKLLNGVKRACQKMSLVIKEERILDKGFSITASQKINWLSTNWPMKFVIDAELIEESYTLFISGASAMGSITQSSNNHAKAQELLSLIQAYAPNAPESA